MNLTPEEASLRSGSRGEGAAKAMEILRALGEINGAEETVTVGSVQVSGVSYKNIGEHGLAFLEEWAQMGSRAVVPAFMNPGGADRRLWKSLGFSADFVEKQERVIKALESLGITPTLSCTPYDGPSRPRKGEHLAWAESSAVCYANSVIGARTNREGGPSAIAAALTGRAPKHTLHTEAGRRPSSVVEVSCPVARIADAGALGCVIGRLLAQDPNGGIPFIKGPKPPADPTRDTWLKALGAGMASSGSVGLFHLDGVTPEAAETGADLARHAGRSVKVSSLDEGRRTLQSAKGAPDVVVLGCPHASRDEISGIEKLLAGRKAKVPVWIFTSEETRAAAEKDGSAARLEAAGALLLADTCMVVAPLADLGIRNVATDSAKAAFYLPSHQSIGVSFGPREEALEAAVEGSWKGVAA